MVGNTHVNSNLGAEVSVSKTTVHAGNAYTYFEPSDFGFTSKILGVTEVTFAPVTSTDTMLLHGVYLQDDGKVKIWTNITNRNGASGKVNVAAYGY